MLGLVLAIGLISIPVFADIDSPNKQSQSGIPLEEIQCSDTNHVLVFRTNGNIACVTESTAGKLNWEKITSTTILNTEKIVVDDSLDDTPNEIGSIEYDEALMSILETDLIFIDKEIDSPILTSIGPVKNWPKYEITFPRTAQVGVPFDVVFDYAFVIPDEETGSYENFNDQCNDYSCSLYYFSAKVSSFVNVTSDNLEYRSETFDPNMIPMRNYTHYNYHPEFDNTRALQEKFTFVINEPNIDYRIGEIHVQIQYYHNDDLVYFYVDENGTVIFDPNMTKDTFEQNAFARSSDSSVMRVASVINAEMDKLQKRPPEYLRNSISAPVGPRDGPPPELYGYFAEKLLRVYPGENYEEFLIYRNFTQSWVNDFLAAMPELRTQAIDFLTSYTLLPLAYGQEDTTTIFGKLVNTDDDEGDTI